MIDSNKFYSEYYGHPLDDLRKLHDEFRKNGKNIIWLVGDSSLDNKHWIKNEPRSGACNGYEDILEPADCVPDVAYWMNYELFHLDKPTNYVCINAAVEESTIGGRRDLLSHDKFVRDHLGENDIIISSMGGNDVALKPSFTTIASITNILYGFGDIYNVENTYLDLLIRQDTQNILEKICRKVKPKCILPCITYYPSLKGKSWADGILNTLKYDKNYENVHILIQQLFKTSTKNIRVYDIQMVPVALYEVLNCEDEGDYVERVEPSAQGSWKMAKEFVSLFTNTKQS